MGYDTRPQTGIHPHFEMVAPLSGLGALPLPGMDTKFNDRSMEGRKKVLPQGKDLDIVEIMRIKNPAPWSGVFYVITYY